MSENDITSWKKSIEIWPSDFSTLPPKNRSIQVREQPRANNNILSQTQPVPQSIRIRQASQPRLNPRTNNPSNNPSALDRQTPPPARNRSVTPGIVSLSRPKSLTSGIAQKVTHTPNADEPNQQVGEPVAAHVKIQSAIARFIESLEEIQVIGNYQRYRSYIFNRAYNFRDYTDQVLGLSQKKRNFWTVEDKHFNIGMGHLVMNLIKGGELNIHFQHLNQEVFSKIEHWMIDWVRRKYQYELALEGIEAQGRKLQAMMNKEQARVHDKKFIPFP